MLTWLMMSVRLATPLLFAALGGLLAERSGVFNFGLEGMMLAGAFFAYAGSYFLGSPWAGLLLAVLIGMVSGLLLAYTSVNLGVSQMVVGIGINIFYLGLTSYLYRLMSSAAAGALSAPIFGDLRVPVLSRIPVIGTVLFHQNIMVYLCYILVAVTWWFLFRTPTGLSYRSCGENPAAADSVGINVHLMRYAGCIASGALAAVGGSFLTLTQVSRFLENMVEGRGWIALTAVILGKWNPWGALGACFLFGAANALQMQMQIIGVNLPYQAVMMIPYILTILALVGVVGRVKGPAARGIPYFKQ
ncbi:MAG TPA: ABC transporter permease [Clostridia bacterium]|nr:ABC transporter permease [Clostridia bacterium]